MSVSKSSESGTTNFSRSRSGSGVRLGYVPPVENYFGSGADGAVTISSNTSLVVPSKNGNYDGDMVVKNYTSLTVNSGVTLTTDQPCRGLLIYVQGDCTISGTLSMTARGAAANPTVAGASDGGAVSADGLKFPFSTAEGSDIIVSSPNLLDGCGTPAKSAIANHPTLIGNGTVLTVSRLGAAGGARTGGGSPISPNDGVNGTTGQSGGGGSGGGYYSYSSGGAGGQGTCFSGGTGGGGAHGGSGADGAAYGGAGGNGGTPDGGYNVPGGIGNPNGLWSNGSYTSGQGVSNSAGGTGGLLVLIVGGTLTIGASGVISANGVTGPQYNNADRGGGGASGGGNVLIAYRSITNSGSITAGGGLRWGWNNSQIGGAGGSGSVQLLEVS